MSAYRHATHDESVESLLEFLRISSRVAVVQLEPPRARAFAEVLARLVVEKGIADRAAAHWEGVAAANALDVVTEVAAEREACAKLAERNGDRVTATSIRGRP